MSKSLKQLEKGAKAYQKFTALELKESIMKMSDVKLVESYKNTIKRNLTYVPYTIHKEIEKRYEEIKKELQNQNKLRERLKILQEVI